VSLDPTEPSDLPTVDVLRLRPLEGRRLWLRFSDGREGTFDLAPLFEKGGSMIEPLRDAAFFARAFVEMGAPTWPNGFDLDPINLYLQLHAEGQLTTADAA
jgi:hypothetical protein